jgi:predicted esterase
MKHCKHFFALVIILVCTQVVVAQTGMTIRFSSSSSMFPDTVRAKGHTYNGKLYDAANHYNDSSVLIYVPENYIAKGRVNLVFWFHGWGNNIDTALRQYQLTDQFEASGRNAIFVFPEGPKNAPDSYGGKLEQPAVFSQLVKEVMDKLAENKVVKKASPFNIDGIDISLAGHSGAYRVISRIINRSPVKEVILFDAMYGGNESYLQWLADPAHRFINIYTKDGGTYDNSRLIMRTLGDSMHIPVIAVDEASVNEQLLRTHRKIFIFSNQSHNGVITYNRNWELFLRNIPISCCY